MKYRVTVHQILSGQTVVEADSTEEAEETALAELAENDFIEEVENTYVKHVNPLKDK